MPLLLGDHTNWQYPKFVVVLTSAYAGHDDNITVKRQSSHRQKRRRQSCSAPNNDASISTLELRDS